MTSTRTLARALAALAFAAALSGPTADAVVVKDPTRQRAQFVPGELLVRWRADAGVVERDAQMVRLGAIAHGDIGARGRQLLRLGRDADLRSALARLRASGLVEDAAPHFRRHPYEACSAIVGPKYCPNDTDFTGLLKSTLYALHDETFDADMDLPQAWATVRNTNGVLIAIIDEGFNLSHQDLVDLRSGTSCASGNCSGNAQFATPTEDHGTLVAGAAGARSDNALGIASPSFDGDLLPIRVGAGFSGVAILAAYDYATTQAAKVMNLSFGSPVFDSADHAELDLARAAGILVVAAAGNDDSNTDKSVDTYPANYDLPNVIAVAASDSRDRIAGFSTWGPTRVDLAAPGAGIRSTWQVGNVYQGVSGTSFSAPYTAGVAALVGQRLIDLGYTTFDYRELKALLLAGADITSDNGDLPLRGRVAAGRVNAANSVAKAAELVNGTLGGVLVVDSVVVDDPISIATGNDDDDLPDAGETVDLIVTLSNAWQAAGTVAGTLSANGVLDATVVDGSDTSTAIGPFGLGSLTFRVTLANTGNTQALFRLDLTPQNGAVQTRYFYLEYSPRLANGVELTQAVGRSEWDEFHAWNVNVPAGATNVVFETSTDGGRDIDLMARRLFPPHYMITLNQDPDIDEANFWTWPNPDEPSAPPGPERVYLSGALDGEELIGEAAGAGGDISGAEDGTWHLVVVNYAQVFLNYRIKASWDAAGAGTIRFNADSATVNESAGMATLTVVRSGGVGAVSANYASAGGTAGAGTDFTAVGGTLNWAAGDTAAKTITVPIANDGVAESAEAFTVALSSPAGGADLGRYQTFTVTIAGSTAPPPPPPPPPPSGGGGGGGGATDALLLLALGALAAARRRRPAA